jgi:hypothetical protein
LDRERIRILGQNIEEVYDGLSVCGQKLTSAVKFVDFFVHDILDYTILNKEEKYFTKSISVFNIQDAVQEIIEIQEDKAHMK